MTTKPLGGKAYGSIPHLPNSRMGQGDHHISQGQAMIACQKARDRHDLVIVTEKLDGSCTAVARIGDDIVALGRAGWPASTSQYEQHQLFSCWVRYHQDRLRACLNDGERFVGEWLAQAHGTRYDLPHEPWVVFDLMRGQDRLPFAELLVRAAIGGFTTPRLLHMGGPISVTDIMPMIESSGHGAIDSVEGAVWRIERKDAFGFLCKWVRPGKVDGIYLPEVSNKEAFWNWRP